MPPAAQASVYWSGWDIARKVVIFPDAAGGYVMDAYGGLHSFGVGKVAPKNPTTTAYWPGWSIARGMVLIPGSESGYVLDGYGGVHPFAAAGQPMPSSPSTTAYWKGWNIARAIWLLPSSTAAAPAGYLLDGYGGRRPRRPAPPIAQCTSRACLDIAER